MQRIQNDIDDDGVHVGTKQFIINMFDNNKGYLFRSRNHNVKTYNDIRLSDVVKSMDDYCKVHLLAEHIYKDTNCIAVRINSRRVRMADIDDIANIIDVSPRRAKDLITRLKKLHVLAVRHDCVGDVVATRYVFNPLFFNSNKYISPELYFLFQDSIDSYIPKWARVRFHEFGNISNDK